VIAVLRFGLGTPHYRLDRLQEALGTPIPDATQWDILHARALEIYPAYQQLFHLAAQAPVLHNDDTHMLVLQFAGKRREKLVEQGELPRPDRTGLFTTGIAAVTPEGPLSLFFTGRRHAGENLSALLERRAKDLEPPLLMCDALDRNLPKGHIIRESNCLAHGRRGVVDQAENFPAECRHVLDQIGQVYAVEEACREENLSPEARLWLHQLVSAPVMKQLCTWMTAQLEEKRIEPNSEMGKAFNYMLKRWDKFTVYLRTAGAPIDNNVAERFLKLAILHRKNSLFYRSERGAVVGDIYMSLIHTAVLHGQNPIDYLTVLMSHYQAVAAAPADWMPWNYRRTLARAPADPIRASGTAAAGATPAAPVPPPEPPTTTGPGVTTSSAAIAAPGAASPLPTAEPPAAAPSTSPSPSQIAPSVPLAQGNRSSRSTSRPKPPILPPPAFVLFTLLWLIAPFAAALHRLDPVVTQPQPPSHAARQATASASTSAAWLASFDATRTTPSAATALAIASPGKPCAPTHRPAERPRRPRSRAPT
jgi:hypothetical protein